MINDFIMEQKDFSESRKDIESYDDRKQRNELERWENPFVYV